MTWMCSKMSRSTREWAKRKLQESIVNLNWCGYHLIEVAEVYKEQHPEIANPIKDIATVASQLMDTIAKVKGSF